MENKIKKYSYNIIRNCLKKYFTNNLGKVVEHEDKIVCYVKRTNVKKENYHYNISCHNIRKKDKELAEKYNLNKPICYIIEGLEFKKDKVYIFGYNNCEVIIKNCKFNFDVNISVTGKCTIENTFIRAFHYLSLGATELTIKDMDIQNLLKLSSQNLEIYLGADKKLEIINSTIGRTKERTNVYLIAGEEIKQIDSVVSGNTIEYQTNRLHVNKDSFAIAFEKLKLKVKEFENLNLTAPIVTYNGQTINKNSKVSTTLYKTDVQENKEKFTASYNKEETTKEKLELVQTLKNIKTKCDEKNTPKVIEYRDYLNNQTLKKVLKK